jgi:hypothetical protein
MTSVHGTALGRSGRASLAGLVVAGTILASADPITFVNFVSYSAVGGFLVARRPRNLIGWLLIAIGFAFIGTTAPPDLDSAALAAGAAPFDDFLWAWVGAWAGGVSWILYSVLAVIFPTGHLPVGRSRRPAIATLMFATVAVMLPALFPTFTTSLDGGASSIVVPNRFAVFPPFALSSPIPPEIIATAIPIALLAAAVGSTITKYRRSAGIVRLQLRWLMTSVAFVVAAVVAGLLGFLVVGPEAGGLVWLPVIVAYPTVPIAVGVAVTRYRLFEIDRIVSRTIGWALVTGIVATVFALGLVALQAALVGFTQGQTLAVAASTLVAFALFQPVRRRVQTAVDRRFDRARYDAQRTVDAFAEHLRSEVDLARLRKALVATADNAVRPVSAMVWLRVGPETGR